MTRPNYHAVSLGLHCEVLMSENCRALFSVELSLAYRYVAKNELDREN